MSAPSPYERVRFSVVSYEIASECDGVGCISLRRGRICRRVIHLTRAVMRNINPVHDREQNLYIRCQHISDGS